MNETTILVIEDDKSIQNFMKISLKTRGYAYILADNGLSARSPMCLLSWFPPGDRSGRK